MQRALQYRPKPRSLSARWVMAMAERKWSGPAKLAGPELSSWVVSYLQNSLSGVPPIQVSPDAVTVVTVVV